MYNPREKSESIANVFKDIKKKYVNAKPDFKVVESMCKKYNVNYELVLDIGGWHIY